MINSQQKGKRAERDVVNWLKAHGWPQARRVVRTGDLYAPDEGDIRGLGPIVLEVKHHAGGLTEGQVSKFLTKLHEQQCQDGELGILVERREGVRDAGSWWAWTDASVFVTMVLQVKRYMLVHVGAVRLRLDDVMGVAADWVGVQPEHADATRPRDIWPALRTGLLDPVGTKPDTKINESSTRVTQAFANPFLDDGETL